MKQHEFDFEFRINERYTSPIVSQPNKLIYKTGQRTKTKI